MTTWTRTLPEKLTKADLDDLRVHLENALRALGEAVGHLADLAGTHQASTGYATSATRQGQAAQIRKDREARYPTKGIGLGQRWFKRADIPAYAAGARPVPVNLPAVSIDAEIPMALIHLNTRVRRDLEQLGLCPLVKPAGGTDRQGRSVTQYPSLVEIFRETRQLTRLIANRHQLLRAVRTLEDLADRAATVVHGPNRMPGDAPCPHCGRNSLVGYVEEGIVRCEPPKGQRCLCADAYCACHTRRDHRHEWTRTPPDYLQGSERKRWRSHSNSLDGLSRAIANAAATRHQQGAPVTQNLSLTLEEVTSRFHIAYGAPVEPINDGEEVLILVGHDKRRLAIAALSHYLRAYEADTIPRPVDDHVKPVWALFTRHIEDCSGDDDCTCIADYNWWVSKVDEGTPGAVAVWWWEA